MRPRNIKQASKLEKGEQIFEFPKSCFFSGLGKIPAEWQKIISYDPFKFTGPKFL